jgi:ribosome maturation factor RimP
MGVSPIFCLWRRFYMDLQGLLDNTLAGMGYELVDLERSAKGGFMRVFIDRIEGITVEDCALVSNHLTRLFAVEDVRYDRLEVSSPGLDRPLRKPQDFVRFAGHKAKLKLRLPVNGQRNFVGILRAYEEGRIGLEVEGRLLMLELGNLDKARLMPEL